ncbi:MAG: aminotransferase class I/II-fold pyridoxal phosphate-dependent enzyme [Chloroflexi bacterium]|nr:aminotransferase class I/II-fold pyridoxal phosphate-dependent enzyme [Chloroflexota bacterium]
MRGLKPRDQIKLSAEEMREMGYRIIDMLVDYNGAQAQFPVTRALDQVTFDEILSEPLPEKGSSWEDVLEQFERQALSTIDHLDHPRFFAYIPSSSNFVSAMADTLASGYNIFNALYPLGTGAAQVERLTIGWLLELVGMPEEAGGLFVSGGAVANLTGLAVARQILLNGDMRDAVIYCSDQAHFVISRGLRILGFGHEQLREIQADKDFRLPVAELETAIAEDRAAGKRPFCIAATAGTTNTGAVDPLNDLADLCQHEELWLHVDGAYGTSACLTEHRKIELAGIERAHTLNWDAHKWMFQPVECSTLLVQDRHWLGETFKDTAHFLSDAEEHSKREAGEEMNYMYQGIQLTRYFRALKFWMSLKVFGLGAMRQAIERGFKLAEMAESLLRDAGKWEIVTAAQMAIVTFRYKPSGGDESLADAVTDALPGAWPRIASPSLPHLSCSGDRSCDWLRTIREPRLPICDKPLPSWGGWRQIWRGGTRRRPQTNNSQRVAASIKAVQPILSC